jgi:DNA-binding SARP family transcriptional activator
MLKQKLDGEVLDEAPLPPRVSIPSTATISESLSPRLRSRKQESASQEAGGQARQFAAQSADLIPVAVHMLGTFSLNVQDLKLKLPPSRGLSVLKYLLLHHKKKVAREVLMDVFWPDAEPDTARNSLNVAMHSLRKALRTIIFLPVIVFEDGAYGLESNLQVWLDVEEFEKCVKAGQRLEARGQLTSAVSEYESAISLYQGDFLEQNLYEEWTVLDRERLRISYLDTLDRLSQIYFSQERYAACIAVCQLILAHDHFREDAHCLLMRCYSRQGQYHLARRQYQVCVDVLKIELEVEPGLETKQLYERIRQRESV